MVNILAAEGIRRLDQAEQVKIYVGGLPQQPEPPLNYQIVYSLEGALDYYTTPSWVLRGGKPMQVDALSELEAVEFPAAGRHARGVPHRRRDQHAPVRLPGQDRRDGVQDAALPGPRRHHAPDPRARPARPDKPVEVKGQRVVPRDLFIAAVHPKLHKPKGQDLVALQVRSAAEGGQAGAR